MIDNSQNVYIPFHLQKCGITTQCTLQVLNNNPHILQTIEQDVYDCLKVLPQSVHHLIRRTVLWINETYVYGLIEKPKVLKHTTTHHCERWLIGVHDIPEKVLGIEIYDCNEYMRNRNHWNGCGLLLHEYCHLMHQLVLNHGLDNYDVISMYKQAMESGKYEDVLR